MSHEPAWKDQVEYRGRTYHLTTEHALSSYGIPVVVCPETREVYDFESIVRGKDRCFYGAEIYKAAGYPVPQELDKGELMEKDKSLDTARGDMPYLIGRLQGNLKVQISLEVQNGLMEV